MDHSPLNQLLGAMQNVHTYLGLLVSLASMAWQTAPGEQHVAAGARRGGR